MNKEVEVCLDFINDNGELKHVTFYLDETTFNMLQTCDLSSKEKERYLIEKYHEYELEKYYSRKYEVYDEETLEEISYYKNIDSYKDNLNHQSEINELKDVIKTLSERQQLLIELIYFKGMTQKEVSKKLGLSKQTINNSLDRIYKNLRKKIKKF